MDAAVVRRYRHVEQIRPAGKPIDHVLGDDPHHFWLSEAQLHTVRKSALLEIHIGFAWLQRGVAYASKQSVVLGITLQRTSRAAPTD